MSKKKTNKQASSNGWGYLVIFLIALVIVIGLFVGPTLRNNINGSQDATDTASGNFKPIATSPSPTIEDLEDAESDDFKGLQVVKVGSYSGLFLEDGSNDVLSRILMIIVKNNGDRTVQYAEIEMTDGETTAYFSLSTLPPGESVVLLEKNRMSYADGKDLTEATMKNVALYQQEPTLCEDLLKIQELNGFLNVTNISGEDIDGDIVIYYKNAASDLLYGGITYRITIKGGLDKDELRQIAAKHFTPKGSRIMWVTVG